MYIVPYTVKSNQENVHKINTVKKIWKEYLHSSAPEHLHFVKTDIALQFDCSFGYKAAFGNHTKGVLLLKVGKQGFCGPGFLKVIFPSQCMIYARYEN